MEVLEGASTLERNILRQAKAARLPVNGSMELTPLCNMNCDMCYVRLSRAQMEARGRLKTGAEWLRLGREMKGAGVLFLLLTGGEPLTHPDFKELYLGLRALGMILTINTNGTLIDEEWAAFFGQYPPRRINITLYGADNGAYERLCHRPGGFDCTVNAIRLLKQNGVDVKVSSSLTRANRDDWPRILRIGQALDVPVRMDTYMCPATRERNKPFEQQVRMDPEEAARTRVQVLRAEMGDEIFLQSAALQLNRAAHGPAEPGRRGLRCMAGSCSFAVNWQGKLRPCVISSAPEEDAFSLGFSTAWARLVDKSEELQLSPTCAACQLRDVCITCAQYALYECGACDTVPAYLCRYTRETLREMDRVSKLIRQTAGVQEVCP